MSNYKTESCENGFLVINADTGLPIVGGPYKNEESAKRRIRDLKRRDIENAVIVTEAATAHSESSYCCLCGALNGHHLSCVTIMRDAIEAEVANSESYYTVKIHQSTLAIVNSRGVYPHVAKKYYRAQWRS
jgi:hypothetical protein